MATRAPERRDLAKWLFFLVVAAAVLLVLYVDERFLIEPADPEWKHIAPFAFPLFFHGVAGATALAIGPWQFSDRLRRTNAKLHRWLGRTYVGAVAIAAPLGGLIGFTYEGPITRWEQIAQSGGWFLVTAMGLWCARNRNFNAHKLWMMRSYGFALVFISSRVPDALPGFHWTDAMLANSLWWLVVAALIVPDLILAVRGAWRRSANG
jgi:hypothetical protein